MGQQYVAACVFGVLALFGQQGQETLKESNVLADGSVETWEYVLGKDNERVRHGDYRRVFPDGATIAEEGDYRDGVRAGKWRSFFESGNKESEGSYRAGKRSRSWRHYFDREGKASRARGSYVAGLRDGKWTYFLESGEVDPSESGTYQVFDDWCLPGRVSARGELRKRSGGEAWERHGKWRFAWPDGATMLEAEFKHDEAAGDWRFYHCDGSYDPGFLAKHSEGLVPSSGFVDENAPVIDAIEKWLPVSDADLANLVEAALENLEITESGLTPALIPRVAQLTGQVLRQMVELDFENSAQARLGVDLEKLLRAFVRNRAFDDAARTGPPSALTVHRWFSLWWLTKDNLFFWRLKMQQPKGDGPEGALLEPELPNVPVELVDSRSGSPELESALNWLALHQSPDGSWSSAGFNRNCAVPKSHRRGADPTAAEIEAARCGGAGYPEHDVGVTGLALLAFFHAGQTPSGGEHKNVVASGLLWLTAQCGSEGLIGNRASREFLYNHAIATQALAVALGSMGEIRQLREVVQRAVDLIHEARDPVGAWRYDWPSLQESDTSMTGWMLGALRAARDAGIAVDPVAIHGGLSFIEKMTDPENGRIGYLSTGSGSARISGINVKYSVEEAETMTAIGLLSYLLVAPQLSEVSALEQHGDLIMKTLPSWKSSGNANDMYYWRAASEAFYHSRGISSKWMKRWKSWSKAMRATAKKSQLQTGDETGSWDPIGPWGFSGGRVYSTAMMALALISTED